MLSSGLFSVYHAVRLLISSRCKSSLPLISVYNLTRTVALSAELTIEFSLGLWMQSWENSVNRMRLNTQTWRFVVWRSCLRKSNIRCQIVALKAKVLSWNQQTTYRYLCLDFQGEVGGSGDLILWWFSLTEMLSLMYWARHLNHYLLLISSRRVAVTAV